MTAVLTTLQTGAYGQNMEAVERLKILLAEAEAGGILSIAYVVERPSGYGMGFTRCDDWVKRVGLVSLLFDDVKGYGAAAEDAL